MAAVPVPISCRWDWCRSSFTTIDALDAHVKHDHIWPMKPMRKADIALMRRMDLQSLHSSQSTDSSAISRGLVAGVSRSKTPLLASPRPENDVFDTFAQLSSPPQVHSPQGLPASPAFESLMRQDGRSGLSAAFEMLERAHAHKANQHLSPSSRQHSPTHHPLSDTSGSSQEVVEQQLTQQDVGSQPRHPFPLEQQIGDEFVDPELRWPSDDEPDELATKGTQKSEQPVSEENSYQSISRDSTRDRNFRRGSLSVPLGLDNRSPTPPHTLQGAHSQSQPIVLQTQAPYFSQVIGSSQTS